MSMAQTSQYNLVNHSYEIKVLKTIHMFSNCGQIAFFLSSTVSRSCSSSCTAAAALVKVSH